MRSGEFQTSSVFFKLRSFVEVFNEEVLDDKHFQYTKVGDMERLRYFVKLMAMNRSKVRLNY